MISMNSRAGDRTAIATSGAILVLLLALATSARVPAQQIEFENLSVESRIKYFGMKAAEVRDLLDALKQRVGKDDRAGVCALADYPLRVRRQRVGAQLKVTNGVVRNAADCLKSYSEIFNGKVIAAIKQQRFENLFVNYQGVMVGQGEIWMSSVPLNKSSGRFGPRIITVNN
jgi:hypothetical protein